MVAIQSVDGRLVEGCRMWQVEGLREPGAVSLGVETFTIRCTMFQYNA
ncbi:MAG: hypothetical protein ACYCXI_07235 [Dethiobacteraceae bacterium]